MGYGTRSNKKYGRLVPALILTFMFSTQDVCKAIYREHQRKKQIKIYNNMDIKSLEKRDEVIEETNRKNKRILYETDKEIEKQPTTLKGKTSTITKYKTERPDDD
ncbi:MAG: hypothetical protein JSV39_04560 [Candidatus Aenigmatarchaeota archaeon]|nr:MAG: hypothetical protein JSV39_04560 [Candidatus Aenigmarchaeota archaeon]